MRRRIALQTAAYGPDGGGGAVISWTTIAMVWAEIRSLSGADTVVAEGLQGRVTHELTLRKRMDVSPAMRVMFGQRIFIIRAVLDRDLAQPLMRVQAEERML